MTASWVAITAARLASIASSQSARNWSGSSATPARETSSYTTIFRICRWLACYDRNERHGRGRWRGSEDLLDHLGDRDGGAVIEELRRALLAESFDRERLRVPQVEHLDRREHHALLAHELIGHARDPRAELGVAVAELDDRGHAEASREAA